MGKYYAIRKGRETGIFDSWDKCKSLVAGFSGAEYKSFSSKKDAEAYLYGSAESICSTPSENYAFVDGSFNSATGTYGYGGFLIANGEKIILQGNGNDPEMASMRNVAGEVLGATAAMEKAIELGLKTIDIHYDYMGIEKWATGEWKRTKSGTKKYFAYVQMIQGLLEVHFVKVKGHSGIEGNEEADALAKQAVGIM